jgi:hypothetical protein
MKALIIKAKRKIPYILDTGVIYLKMGGEEIINSVIEKKVYQLTYHYIS